jgi:hypothetical protein
MLTFPISQIGINKEWAVICAMAKSSGFPEGIIYNLRRKLTLKKQTLESTATESNQKWVPFTYFGPAVRRITNLFKCSNIKIAFRTTNTIQRAIRGHRRTVGKPCTCNNYIREKYELNPLYNCIYETKPPLSNLITVSDLAARNTYLQEDTGIT